MKETSSTANLLQRAFGWCKDAKASCEYTPEWPPEQKVGWDGSARYSV